MRTPKIEALQRTIYWLNNYIEHKKFNKLPITKTILSNIHKLEIKPLDSSPIDSNNWLSGFSDADSNFSVNIHKRSGKTSTRVQLYYRLEVRQTYHRLDTDGQKTSYFTIMSNIAKFLGVNLYSRCRTINEKDFYSYTIVAHNNYSKNKIVEYFTKYPLLSSKYLDYKDWLYILGKQEKLNLSKKSIIQKAKATKSNLYEDNNKFIIHHKTYANSFLDEAIRIRTNFNKTRTQLGSS